MANMFHPEGKFAQYGGKLADLMWLNLLTLLCLLPVVTAGASFCGMHYVLLKLHRGEDVSVTRGFFKSFRSNFKQALILSVAFFVVVYLLAVGIRYVYTSQVFPLGRYLIPLTLLVVMSIFNWAVILLSRYHNTVLGTLRLAVMTALGYPIRSVLMLVLAVVPFAALFLAEGNLIIVLIGAVALTGFLQTVLYNGVLRRMEQEKN